MDLPNQAQRKWEGSEPIEAVVHGADVVHDLFHIARYRPNARAQLHCEQVLEGALRSFDLRTEDGLPSHVHGDEEVRVREMTVDDSVKPPDCLIRPRKEGEQARAHHVDRGVRRQRSGDKAAIALCLPNVLAGPCVQRRLISDPAGCG